MMTAVTWSRTAGKPGFRILDGTDGEQPFRMRARHVRWPRTARYCRHWTALATARYGLIHAWNSRPRLRDSSIANCSGSHAGNGRGALLVGQVIRTWFERARIHRIGLATHLQKCRVHSGRLVMVKNSEQSRALLGGCLRSG